MAGIVGFIGLPVGESRGLPAVEKWSLPEVIWCLAVFFPFPSGRWGARWSLIALWA